MDSPSEVAKLGSSLVDEDVFRLDIAVDDIL